MSLDEDIRALQQYARNVLVAAAAEDTRVLIREEEALYRFYLKGESIRVDAMRAKWALVRRHPPLHVIPKEIREDLDATIEAIVVAMAGLPPGWPSARDFMRYVFARYKNERPEGKLGFIHYHLDSDPWVGRSIYEWMLQKELWPPARNIWDVRTAASVNMQARLFVVWMRGFPVYLSTALADVDNKIPGLRNAMKMHRAEGHGVEAFLELDQVLVAPNLPQHGTEWIGVFLRDEKLRAQLRTELDSKKRVLVAEYDPRGQP